MDTNKRITLLKFRAEIWEEVLLYNELRKGPETKNAQGEIDWGDAKWSQTLKRLETYLANKDNQPRLVKELFLGEIDKDWTRDKYIGEVRKVCKKISNYNEQPGQPDDVKRLGKHLSEILAQQSGRYRTREELLRDFNIAGQLEPHPADPEAYLVRNHHGKKQSLPKAFLPESFHWSMDQILADDSNEGRRFKSDDCVRLVTDRYAGLGLFEGIEGYVSGVVSNKYLGWEANYCHVIFILACEEDGTVVEDFLEVRDDDLRLCDKENPPTQFFPYEVARNGRMMLERHENSKPYTYDDLVDFLRDPSRKSRQQSDISKEEESPSSKEEKSPSSKGEGSSL